MITPTFKRSIEDLIDFASMFWPADISLKEAELSVIPKLIETQDQFIAILSVQVTDIDAFFQIINSSTLPANLFLKHSVVLADFGGEMLQRVNSQFRYIVRNNIIEYIWNGKTLRYTFSILPLATSSTLTNDRRGISGKTLLTTQPLTPLHKAVIALLLFGASSTDEELAHILLKCEISNYLGDPDKLEKFIKQRYIWVSRTTGGSAKILPPPPSTRLPAGHLAVTDLTASEFRAEVALET